MANLPFALSGATAPTLQPTQQPTLAASGTPFDPSSIKSFEDLVAWAEANSAYADGKSGPQALLAPAPFGNGGMNPLYSMASFYNTPYYHATPRSSGQIHQAGMVYPPGTGGPVQPGSGSSNSGTPYVPPPVTVPPVQGTGGGFTGVPGMNGTPGGYGVSLLAPPSMGTGAQWRNTMKYGA